MAPDDKRPPSEDRGDVVALSRFRASLARARTTRRADLILEDPDADRLIPTLPVQDLYLAIKDVGLADAEELVARASPEQLQGFFDLDAWERDELSVDRLRPWIDALVAAGPEKVAEIAEAMDPEELALYIQKQATVYDLTMEAPPEEPEGRLWPTPDTFYVLDIKPSGEEGKSLERFVDHLYRADLSLGRRAVMSAKWELGSDLEEWAYRFRQGRLADLGFPDPDEAMAIYRPIDLRKLRASDEIQRASAIAEPGIALPSIVADAIDPRSLLGLALAEQGQGELEHSYAALVTLFNRALAADRVDPADFASARRVLEDVLAYLGLGLELVAGSGGAPSSQDAGPRAAQALARLPLETIFRAGYTLTVSLGQLAETLYTRGRVRLGTPPVLLLDGRHREVLTALRNAGARGRRPRMPRVLDTPPAAGSRPFRSAADVRLAASALESASRLPVLFFDDLGLSLESVVEAASASPGLSFGTLMRTLAARVLVGGRERSALAAAGPVAIAALRPPEVGALLARLRDGVLTDEDQQQVGAAVTARIASRGRAAPAELPAWFAAWFERLGRRVAEVDGLYVTA